MRSRSLRFTFAFVILLSFSSPIFCATRDREEPRLIRGIERVVNAIKAIIIPPVSNADGLIPPIPKP